MEITQFASYLDYGVLGLSAIILILSFVLLSREQKRDDFRPEVANAIRKYMMLALAFAGIGLASTVLEGIFVKPAKKEKQEIEAQKDRLSDTVSKHLEKNMTNEKFPSIANIDADSLGEVVIVSDSISDYNKLKKSVFLSFYDFSADKELFSEAIDKLGKEHKDVADSKEQILGDYDQIADMKKEWLEKKAIPALEKARKDIPEPQKSKTIIIIDLPSELVDTPDRNNKTTVENLEKMKKELNLLKERK